MSQDEGGLGEGEGGVDSRSVAVAVLELAADGGGGAWGSVVGGGCCEEEDQCDQESLVGHYWDGIVHG